METIRIAQATKSGSIEVEVGGAFDMSYPDNKTRRGRVQDGGKISPTIQSQSMEIGVVEPVIGALRGSNPDDPANRTSGVPTQQMLEMKEDGTSNTLTTVQKDNLVCEKIDIQCMNSKINGKQPSLSDRVYSSNGTSTTIATSPFFTGSIMQDFRIRKLTPRECWRLMGFSEEDFDRARQVNSDAQLYKQAGNSIVVNVLMEIFKQML